MAAPPKNYAQKLGNPSSGFLEFAGSLPIGSGYLTVDSNGNIDSTEGLFSNVIGSLNGLTDETQTFAVGTTAQSNNIGWVSSSGVHTLHIPDASATDRGVVTTGTQTFAGAKTTSGQFTNAIGTITASTPFTISQTWNNAGVQFTSFDLAVTGTAFAPTTSYLMNVRTVGYTAFTVRYDGSVTCAGLTTGSITWHSLNGADASYVYTPSLALRGTGGGYITDAVLTRDSAGNIAQRNSTNAQNFRIYNTYTDASNYERGRIGWSSDVFKIGTEKLGTGVARGLALQTDGTDRLTISSTGDVATVGSLTITSLKLEQVSNLSQDLFGGQYPGIRFYDPASPSLSRPIKVAAVTIHNSGGYGNGYTSHGMGELYRDLTLFMESKYRLIMATNGSIFNPDYFMGFGSSNTWTGNVPSVGWYRGGDYILEQRYGTNAQTYRIYNTYTNASNYERARLGWDTNVFVIGTQKLGTGAARGVAIQTDGTDRMTFGSAGGVILNTIIRHSSEITSTPSGTTQTITLNDGNHQTLSLASSTGDVTVTLTVPSSSSDGTILIKQHGSTPRDITWTASSGTIYWLGTEPTWSGQSTSEKTVVDWRFDGTDLYLSIR